MYEKARVDDELLLDGRGTLTALGEEVNVEAAEERGQAPAVWVFVDGESESEPESHASSSAQE